MHVRSPSHHRPPTVRTHPPTVPPSTTPTPLAPSCSRLGDSQMWNYGYETTTLYDGSSAPSLASEVCIDVWMKDTVDGTNATLSTRCVDMGEPTRD